MTTKPEKQNRICRIYDCFRVAIVILGVSSYSHAWGQGFVSPVEVDPVTLVSVNETVSVFGKLVSHRSGTIDTAVAGLVNEIRARVGDRVVEGQVVATLDSSTLELAKRTAEAKAQMAMWTIKRRTTELELAEQKEERLSKLQLSAATTKAEHEDSVLLLQAARESLGEAEANQQLALRDLDLANHRVELTEIIAPYDGVIVEQFIEEGQYAHIGTKIVRIVADQSLEIEADIPYRYVGSLNIDDAIFAQFDDGTRFEAAVRTFIPEEHFSTRTRAVRFAFEMNDAYKTLAINQNVVVEIPISKERDAMTVHKDAIITQGANHIVYVVNEDTAVPRIISIGNAVENRFEVTSGLSTGDIVVVRGNERLTPGQKIRIVNQNQESESASS